VNKYEILFILKPDLPEDQIQEIIDRLTQRIESTEGKVAAIDYWGHRMLAYPITYRGERIRRGYYILLTYVGNGGTVEEIERNIKILDPTFRYLTVKLEEGIDPESIIEVEITRRKDKAPPRKEEPETQEEDEWPENGASEAEPDQAPPGEEPAAGSAAREADEDGPAAEEADEDGPAAEAPDDFAPAEPAASGEAADSGAGPGDEDAAPGSDSEDDQSDTVKED
jgi:small subunit ribosomal protein S6